MKSGITENGTWKVITFLIEKTRRKKPIKIPFVAKGKLAEKVESIVVGEKLTIRFYIEGKKYNDKYFTDCIAIEIDKFVTKSKYQFGSIAFGNEVFEDGHHELQKDNNLFNQ
jgi:hypothetical protein